MTSRSRGCRPKRAIWIAAIVFICASSLANPQSLEPYICETPDFGFDLDYDSRLRRILFEAFHDDESVAEFVVAPAFGPEWGVAVVIEQPSTATVKCAVAADQVWGANWVPDADDKSFRWSQELVTVEVKRRQSPLPYDTAVALYELWHAYLRSPVSITNGRIGNDGTTYTLATKSSGSHACGKLWSPEETSLPQRFIGAGEKLRELCDTESFARNTAIQRWLAREAHALKAAIQ